MVTNNSCAEKLMSLDKRHFLHPTSSIKDQQANGPAWIFTEGHGIYLTDIRGRTVIDGMSSLWNVNIGHGREEVARAAMEQMTKLAYSSCFATYSNEPAILLAEKLFQISPGDLVTTFFTSGGSESNDTAFKLARHYWILKGQPRKTKIISRNKSYHGLTMGATSATGLDVFHEFSGSLAPGFCHVDNLSAHALQQVIAEEGPETVAAFVAEPIQGAGGVHLPPANYFTEVKRICEDAGILFLVDEVITGFGRTGQYFGMEHHHVTPDMMIFAKGVTSGYAQLGGVMLSQQLMDELFEHSTNTLFHGYTYSGHPTACTVALKNIEIIEREQLVRRAQEMGDYLRKGLEWLKEQHFSIRNVSCLGLIAGIELGLDWDSDTLRSVISPKVVAAAAERGLIVRSVTFQGQDRVVLAPPLIINPSELEKIVEILHESLRDIEYSML